MSTPPIRRVSYWQILCARNARELIGQYAAECSVPDYHPQSEIYAALEHSGALQCFGAYLADELIGFISVLSAVMPHNGVRVANIESFFVLSPQRRCGTGNALLSAAETYATESGCGALVYNARVGSRLEKILTRRANCERSHSVFTRWLK
jgi:GNAT superfamily N-acetyltransferase